MDQDKPFKTIEVVDSRTEQLCKVACMSCIRGHRTTSCGIPVCRTKVFWTVKRPGRPSNSCTCRYGASGNCKCVVAKSACPHKAKKGEKRSGECRCDEQGRYCCLLEPEHWKALHALQKPVVDFFHTREQLEANQRASNHATIPRTPSYPIASPLSTHSIPTTPIPLMNSGYNSYQSMQSSSLTPRFGMMGVGGPQGSAHSQPPDPLAWEGQAPPAPREINLPPMYETRQPEQSSCCQSATPRTQSIASPTDSRNLSFSQTVPLQDMSLSQSYNGMNGTNGSASVPPTMSPAPLPPVYEQPPFDFGRWQAQYYAHQLPNAICQNCGLSGCTCRNCPPIFQHPGTTSWAQCCGRKHARDVQPTPAPAKMPRTENYAGEGLRAQAASSHAPAAFMPQPDAYQSQALFGSGQYGETFPDMDPRPPDSQHPGFPAFDLDNELLLTDTGQLGDLSDFLLSDLDRSNENGSGGAANGVEDAGGGNEDDGGGGGGGGCCCSGNDR